MHIQKNAEGQDEAVGSIHKQQLEVAGVPVAPYNEEVVVEQVGPITALGVPPSTELANQEPAGGGESVTTGDVNPQPNDEVLSERNTREELDAEAEKRGLDPTEYANKRELLDAIEEHDEQNG